MSAGKKVRTAPGLPAGGGTYGASEADVTRGWKVWSLEWVVDDPRLGDRFEQPGYYLASNLVASDGSRYLWLPGEPSRALCLRPEGCAGAHIAGPSCTCGIRGWRSESLAWASDALLGMTVYGEVALWGRKTTEELTVRAEFAYPRKLIAPAQNYEPAMLRDVVAALAKYQVPVLIRDELQPPKAAYPNHLYVSEVLEALG